jgi:hypothetical protein
MNLKGGVLENKRRRRRENMEFFIFYLEKIIRRVKGTYNRKPHTLF